MASIRNTNQRIMILKHLRSLRSHPTAEMVYNNIKKDLPAISLATVYRNLHSLSASGEIKKLEFGKELRFDAHKCGHEHFVCEKCEKIIDVDRNDVYSYAMQKASEYGLNANCISIIYKGECDECTKRKK